MKVAILGAGNGMLSNAIGKYLKDNYPYFVLAIGRNYPSCYIPDQFVSKDLLENISDYCCLIKDYDIIIYAAGAGVQAALQEDPLYVYRMNLDLPISISLFLNREFFRGTFVSFGSYMEIGHNNEKYQIFDENDVIYSKFSIDNDYSISKRLYSQYINNLNVVYRYYHFILPNLFSKNETGTRLLPYIVNYLKTKKQGLKIQSPSFSSGEQVRQYVFVEEMIKSVCLCFEKQIPNGIYNIGGGEILSIRELIEKLFIAYNVEIDDSFFGKENRRDNGIKSLSLDGSKLVKSIGFMPSIKVSDIYHE